MGTFYIEGGLYRRYLTFCFERDEYCDGLEDVSYEHDDLEGALAEVERVKTELIHHRFTETIVVYDVLLNEIVLHLRRGADGVWHQE